MDNVQEVCYFNFLKCTPTNDDSKNIIYRREMNLKEVVTDRVILIGLMFII
jgi:hypothetical protein